jgi:hypothetical protein
MVPHDWDSTNTERLAHLLQMSEGNDVVWDPGELAALFRHQLQSPIEYDLRTLPRAAANRLKLMASAQGLLLKSFADLFQHPHPPLELLKLTKQFAKAHHNDPDTGLPAEIALMLYYTSIAAALVRCHKRISKLDNVALVEGFAWARDQKWVDEQTRGLFDEGLNLLKGDQP